MGKRNYCTPSVVNLIADQIIIGCVNFREITLFHIHKILAEKKKRLKEP